MAAMAIAILPLNVQAGTRQQFHSFIETLRPTKQAYPNLSFLRLLNVASAGTNTIFKITILVVNTVCS